MKLYYSKARQAFFVRFKDEQGVWQSKAVPKSISNEEQARLWVVHWQKDKTTSVARPRPTFNEVCAMWLERKEKLDDPKLLSGCRSFAKKWCALVGDQVVEDFSLGSASRWVESVRDNTKSHYTARNIVATMRNMIVEARGMEWIVVRENVFADPWMRRIMKAGDKKKTSSVIVRLERHQAIQLVQHPLLSPERRLRYMLAISSALRLGELLALRHADIRDGIIDVHRQLTDGRFKPPKKGSKRLVPLHPELKALFRGNVVSSTPVLANKDGGNWSRQLREDLAVCGLSPRHRSGANLTFHSLRRTGLTIMRSSGMSMDDIRAIAGHCGRSVTERHYADADLKRLADGIRIAFDGLLVATPERVGSLQCHQDDAQTSLPAGLP